MTGQDGLCLVDTLLPQVGGTANQEHAAVRPGAGLAKLELFHETGQSRAGGANTAALALERSERRTTLHHPPPEDGPGSKIGDNATLASLLIVSTSAQVNSSIFHHRT